MTVQELRRKHNRKAKRQRLIRNSIGFLILTIVMYGFMSLAIGAWEKEIDAHGEYNSNYIKQLEMERLGK